LANEYFHKTEPFGFWKDTGIRLEGDAVQSLTVTFLEMWNAIAEGDVDDLDYQKYLFHSTAKFVMKETDNRIREKYDLSEDTKETIAKGIERIEKYTDTQFEKIRSEIEVDERYLKDARPVDGKRLGFVQPYADSPMDDIHVGEDVYISMAECAQDYVWFITPYLIITDEMNNHYHTPEELHELLEELTCREVPAHVGIVPPFSTDFGANIIFEDGVYINAGVSMQDQGGILIKEGALIGHHVVLATLNHVLDPARRHDLIPKPIVIGRNAWIGANATILQGVTVGDGAVVAAGAVVTDDVPANTVVGGIPAKVIRKI
jgi:acetyltransferase-like isoleucine patch superfamily enzyme